MHTLIIYMAFYSTVKRCYFEAFSTAVKERRANAKFDFDLSNTKYKNKPFCLVTGRNKWYCSPKVI